MKSFALVSLTILVCNAVSAFSVPNPMPDIETIGRETYCGQKLNKAMKTFCHPAIKSQIVQRHASRYSKRTSEMLDQLWNSFYNDDDDFGNYEPLQSIESPYDVIKYYTNVKRAGEETITRQCCHKQCTLATLIEFCPS